MTHFEALPTVLVSLLKHRVQRLKDRHDMVKKKKKKDCPIYSMLLSVGAVHDHQDTATKNTTTEVHISHSDSFI